MQRYYITLYPSHPVVRKENDMPYYFEVETRQCHVGCRAIHKKPEVSFVVQHSSECTVVDILIVVCSELGGTTKKNNCSIFPISDVEFEERRGQLYKHVGGYVVYRARQVY